MPCLMLWESERSRRGVGERREECRGGRLGAWKGAESGVKIIDLNIFEIERYNSSEMWCDLI